MTPCHFTHPCLTTRSPRFTYTGFYTLYLIPLGEKVARLQGLFPRHPRISFSVQKLYISFISHRKPWRLAIESIIQLIIPWSTSVSTDQLFNRALLTCRLKSSLSLFHRDTASPKLHPKSEISPVLFPTRRVLKLAKLFYDFRLRNPLLLPDTGTLVLPKRQAAFLLRPILVS
jgi:hypothetical protein